MPTPRERLATMLGTHSAAKTDAAALLANAAAVAEALIEHSARFREVEANLASTAQAAGLPPAPAAPAGAPKWAHTLVLLLGMAAAAWLARAAPPAAPAMAPAAPAVTPASAAAPDLHSIAERARRGAIARGDELLAALAAEVKVHTDRNGYLEGNDALADAIHRLSPSPENR